MAARKPKTTERPAAPPRPAGRDLALLCAEAALLARASGARLLEVGPLTSYTDFFLLLSGRSSRQVQGIADRVEAALKDIGVRPLGIEGNREGHWVLMDYGDVVVHIFYEPVRVFYDLEGLFAEAPEVPLDEVEARARAAAAPATPEDVP